MSWSASSTGTPAAVRTAIGEQLDRCAGNYRPAATSGDAQAAAELADIEHARSSINAQLDSMPSGYNGAKVEASGSRGWSTSLKVEVTPLQLALDAPAPTT